MDLVGKTVYINLDKRTDRRAQIEEELTRWGLKAERFSAYEVPVYGLVGCAHSHCEVLRQAMEEGVSSLLVIEDDVRFLGTRSEADARIRAALDAHPDYDVLMLDYNIQKCSTATGGVGKIIEASVASMYLVNGHYLPTLYHNFLESYNYLLAAPHMHWVFSCDQYWKRLQSVGKWFYLSPRVGAQRSGYSDICNGHVEHTYASQ
jgi:hypothetical protein